MVVFQDKFLTGKNRLDHWPIFGKCPEFLRFFIWILGGWGSTTTASHLACVPSVPYV